MMEVFVLNEGECADHVARNILLVTMFLHITHSALLESYLKDNLEHSSDLGI